MLTQALDTGADATHRGQRQQRGNAHFLRVGRNKSLTPWRDWRAAELRECQRHAARHTQRLARRSGRPSERPVGRMPTACHRWAETMAPLACCIPLLLVSRDGVGPSPAPLERVRTQEDVWLSSVAEVAAFFVPALARGAASPLDIWPLRVDTRTTLENRVKNDYIFSSLAMSKDFSLPMEFSGRVAL